MNRTNMAARPQLGRALRRAVASLNGLAIPSIDSLEICITLPQNLSAATIC